MKTTNKSQRKQIEKGMRDRAVELLKQTGFGWNREQLMTDSVWKELSDKKQAL